MDFIEGNVYSTTEKLTPMNREGLMAKYKTGKYKCGSFRGGSNKNLKLRTRGDKIVIPLTLQRYVLN